MRLEEHEKDKLLTFYFLFYWKRDEIPSLIESGKHFPFPAGELCTFCLQVLFKLLACKGTEEEQPLGKEAQPFIFP